MLRKRDYFYHLPPDRIAQAPTDRRDGSRLLRVLDDRVEDRQFAEIAELVPENAVVVINDTKVIPARLHTCKDTGGAVELLLLEPAADGCWRALARSSKPLRDGARLAISDRSGGRLAAAPEVVVRGSRAADGTVLVELPADSASLLDRYGELPLPPYIERPDGATEADRERYQTVYAREPGAVAAPTAGLHLTDPLLAALRGRGCAVAPVTLHVGLGTFSPVRGDDLDDHQMHVERYAISEQTAALVNSGRSVVAVGTTVVRALEAAGSGGAVVAGPGSTDLFIRPGFQFRVVDRLITNFHLPESTLLVLVCSFAGRDRVLAAYRHAVAAGYRFYSYGDAMLLARGDAA